MGDRIQLHTLLCGILGCPERGDACRAYFQPPASKEIQYHCIVYERSEISAIHADNAPYRLLDRNCETYATWLLGETPQSPQVQGVIFLGLIAAFLRFA